MSFKRLYLSIVFALLWHFVFAQVLEWKHLGPFTTPVSTASEGDWCATGMGWIESLYVSDDLQTLYAGTITSGLFKSEDGGKNWALIRQSDVQYGVLDIDVRGNHIFAALGLTHYDVKFGNGVIYSEDQGLHWSDERYPKNSFENTACWGVAAITKKCIVRANEDALLRTENKGHDWDTILISAENNPLIFRQLIRSSHYKKTCFASGNVLYKSIDAGKSWCSLHQRLSVNSSSKAQKLLERGLDKDELWAKLAIQRIAVAEDPNKAYHLLALYSFDHKTYIDESLDGGKSWKNIYQSHRVQRIDINHAEIAIAPGNSSTVLIGGVNAFLSRDGGRNFKQVTFPRYLKENFVHDDIRAVVMKDSNTFYLGTDGGVVASFDGADSWQNLNGQGLTGMMIYGIGTTDEGFVVGCQDLGTFLYRDSNWLNLGFMYGDGGDAVTIQGKLHTVLGGRYREVSVKPLKPVVYKSPRNRMNPFSSKIYRDPSVEEDIYLVSDQLWAKRGGEWMNLTKEIDNHGYKAADLNINPTNPEVMFFAYDHPSWGDPKKKKLIKTMDGGKTWLDLTSNLPILQWKYITGITTYSYNPNMVFLCLGDLDKGDRVFKVFKSVDGGKNWENWSDGLPPFPCFKIMHIPGSRSGILLSNIKGLYYRNESMDSWLMISEAIPHVAIRDFELETDQSNLLVATYGNGVWSAKLPTLWLID